jgi:hypothetical protein
MLRPVPTLLLLALTTAVPVLSQETVPNASQEAVPNFRKVSVTWSPVHLSLPLVELTGEYRLAPSWSAAVIGGIGSVTAETDPGEEETLDAFELGAQGRYYFLSPRKHEPHAGVEALWMHVSGDIDEVSGEAAGLAVGPFVGYKYTANFGLTFDIQAGYQFLAIRAEATDGTTSDSASDSKGLVLLNLNLGWSF